jgi:hypothetical protein
MLQRHALKMVAMLAIAGCTAPTIGSKDQTKIGNVPEAVTAIAAPGQDLATARLRSEDNCYWYEHSGPVETTLLPLRSTGGNPICVARQT